MKKILFLIFSLHLLNVVGQEYDSISSSGEKFVRIDEPAQFPGGIAEMYKYLGKNMKYPKKARRNRIEGRVFIEFIVEKDGTLTGLKVIRGIGGGCDEEALRVLSEMPKWIPGKVRGVPVRQRMIQNILFKFK